MSFRLPAFMLIGGLPMAVCYAMDTRMRAEPLEIKRARTMLTMLVEQVAAYPEPVAIDRTSGIDPIVLPLRDFLVHYYEKADRETTARELAVCPYADYALQDLWHEVQTKMGIACNALLVGSATNDLHEELSTRFGKVRIHPELAAAYAFQGLGGLDLQGYLRVELMHEAAHLKLKNSDSAQRDVVKRVCALLTVREMMVVLFVDCLDINTLPAAVCDSDVAAAAVNALAHVEHSTRMMLVFDVFAPRLSADFARFFKAISKQTEHDADMLMLEKIDCVHCLKAAAHGHKEANADAWRIEHGYASVAQIEARVCELEGKTCVWHAKHA